jgi:hypothetical protein
VKRAADSFWFTSRELPWLRWWQELILNWVSTWETVGELTVTSADGETYASWDLPSDLDLKRLELEELLDVPVGEG